MRSGYMADYGGNKMKILTLKVMGENETHEVLIDDEDYDKIKDSKWNLHKHKKDKSFYAVSGKYLGNYKSTTIRLHRLIMNCPKNKQVDHINGNTLDNRKSNLRIVTAWQQKQNVFNRKSKSGLRGIYRMKCGWKVRIAKGGKYIFDKTVYSKKEAVALATKMRKELLPFSNEERAK